MRGINPLVVAPAMVLVLAHAAPAAAANAAAPAPPSPEAQAAIGVLKAAFPGGDVRVKEVDAAYVNVSTTSGRTQYVSVSGRLYGPAGAQKRLIYSYVAEIAGPIEQSLAVRLLNENQSGALPFGYWALTNVTPAGHRTVVYQAEVAADATPTSVSYMVSRMAKIADALEAEMTGKDVN